MHTAGRKAEPLTFTIRAMDYHPLVCYDGMTGDLIKIQLRDGTQYSCTGVVDFCSRYWMNICMTIRKSLFYFVVIAVFLRLIFISSVEKTAQAM